MRDKAKELYETGFGTLKKIADELGVSENTVKSWKTRYKWVKPKKIVAPEVKKLQPKKEKDVIEIDYIEEVSRKYKLSNQQVEFAIYYGNGNSIQSSALKAKYSKSYALARAYTMLDNVGIKKIVEYIKKLRYETLMYSEKDVLNQYIRIAQGDMGDYFSDDGVELKDFGEVDTGIIKEYQITIKPDGSKEVKFKLESKHPALKSLGEYFGMFKEVETDEENSKTIEAIDKLSKKLESDFNEG